MAPQAITAWGSGPQAVVWLAAQSAVAQLRGDGPGGKSRQVMVLLHYLPPSLLFPSGVAGRTHSAEELVAIGLLTFAKGDDMSHRREWQHRQRRGSSPEPGTNWARSTGAPKETSGAYPQQ